MRVYSDAESLGIPLSASLLFFMRRIMQQAAEILWQVGLGRKLGQAGAG